MRFVAQQRFEPPVPADGLDEEPLVIHTRSVPTTNESLVIFVHGLGGARYGEKSTWGRLPEFHFEDVPELDVGMYWYRTLFGRLRWSVSVSLEKEADVLADIVRDARGYRRVIFAGHSMGGLLSMAAIMKLVHANDIDTLGRVKGLILMATPQTGSLRVPRSLAWVTKDFRALKPHNPLVTAIHQTFNDRVSKEEKRWREGSFTIPTWAVLGASDFWVDTLSGAVGLARDRLKTVRGTHSSIVKPATKDHDAYLFVLNCVRMALAVPDVPSFVLEVDEARRIRVEPAPAAGIVLDREQVLLDIESFLANENQRLLALYGMSGIGKTAIMAKALKVLTDRFHDALWIDCRREQGTCDVIFASMSELLERNGDSTLRGLWAEAGARSFQVKVNTLIDSLRRFPYVIVLDHFDAWLDRGFGIKDPDLRDLLLSLGSTTHKGKLVFVTSARLAVRDIAAIPLGASSEAELLGLSANDVAELLVACGLPLPGEPLAAAIRDHFLGNPGLICTFGRLVARQHRDPSEALSQIGRDAEFNDLCQESLTDLEEGPRQVLEMLAIHRLPVPADFLDSLGESARLALRTLRDRFLLSWEPETERISVPAFLRSYLLRAVPPDRLLALHRGAAEYFQQQAPNGPLQLSEVEPVLEEGFHRIQLGEMSQAVDRILGAAEKLIAWGYSAKAENAIQSLIEHPDLDQFDRARALLLLASINDGRAEYEAAIVQLDSVLADAKVEQSPVLAADALFLKGRILNSQRVFDEAKHNFDLCIDVCRTYNLDYPLGAAMLARTWAEREGGLPDREVLARLTEVLASAEAAGDHATEVAAHREIGFLLTVGSDLVVHEEDGGGRSVEAVDHLDRALNIALSYGVAKEIGGVFSTLGYLHGHWHDPEKAIEFSRKALDLAEAVGDRWLLPSARTNLASAWVEAGSPEEGIAGYRQAVIEFQGIADHAGEVYASRRLGKLLVVQGFRDDGIRTLRAALKTATHQGLTGMAEHLQSDLDGLATT